MDFKVTSTKNTSGVDKKKKTGRSSAASGVDFASMVDQASATSDVKEMSPLAPTIPVANSLMGTPHTVPSDPQERGAYMLDQLEELEKDILSGNPTKAAERLKQALELTPDGYENLPAGQKQIVDEINLRAATEIAKLEVSDAE